MVPCREEAIAEIEVDILAALFIHIYASTIALCGEVALFIRTIAVIILLVITIQTCSNFCTNGLTGCCIVDTEIVGRTHQLETVVIITELQVFVSREVFSVFVHIIVTDRHEIRLVGCTVAIVELEFLCCNFDTPARTAVIRSIKADACIYVGTTKGIPRGSSTIG